MDVGLGHDKVKPPVELLVRNPIQQLERIGESHTDRFRAYFGEETIIMASATAEAIALEGEGKPRDAD